MEDVAPSSLAPLAGRWDLAEDAAVYVGPQEGSPAQFGLAISGLRLRNGNIGATITFPDYGQSVGRIVFGHNAATGAYFSAGLGGYHYAYLLDEYVPGRGWKGLRTEGSEDNLRANIPYDVEVRLRGQRVALFVNKVRVLEGSLPYPLTDDQIGLFAFGAARVRFSNIRAEARKPQAFVVMQYTQPYNVLFSDVIAPVAKALGFEAFRAADVYRPGLILDDILQGLVESDIIIAEVTPSNPNVFYELGYAHALEKPTILLAERNRELPFDIRGHRVIYYDNTIGGKREVEEDLRRHLRTIRGAWDDPPSGVQS